VKRRELIRLLAGATVWPLAARAQQTAMPVIGFLSSRSPGESSAVVAAFRRGLGEAGFVEGRNAHIAFRWAEGRNDRLPALATDLVTHQASVIVATGGGPSAMAAKTATTTVPIVFTFGSDPVKAGLVASFNRPGGNLTGVSWFSSDLGPKRLELLLELAPKTAVIALLVNPNNAELASQPADFQEAARTLGKQVHIFNASSEKEIDTAFMTFVGQKADALVVGGDPFFTSRREQLITLAARHAVPASYSSREYVADGGLMSYGNSVVDPYRRAGVYAGRILNGAKPADLPVERLTTFELVINLKTAKGLGLTVPDKLLVAADEVIE
jgi:putative tryptophan/tyrosine transport system substrate-binding protein